MRQNIITKQRLIGRISDRSNGAQMFHAFLELLSLSYERLSCLVWPVLRTDASVATAAGARANPKGIAWAVTAYQTMAVNVLGIVPSLGTDQVERDGLIAA